MNDIPGYPEIPHLPEFERDLKKLLKRFRTLQEDLNTLIKAGISPFHTLGKDYGGIVPIEGLGFSNPQVYKVRKFACRSLKGKGVQSGLRLIYAYFDQEKRIELVEIYHKGDKDNEDRNKDTPTLSQGASSGRNAPTRILGIRRRRPSDHEAR